MKEIGNLKKEASKKAESFAGRKYIEISTLDDLIDDVFFEHKSNEANIDKSRIKPAQLLKMVALALIAYFFCSVLDAYSGSWFRLFPYKEVDKLTGIITDEYRFILDFRLIGIQYLKNIIAAFIILVLANLLVYKVIHMYFRSMAIYINTECEEKFDLMNYLVSCSDERRLKFLLPLCSVELAALIVLFVTI